MGVMETVISKEIWSLLSGVLVLETDIKRTFNYILIRVVCRKRALKESTGKRATGGACFRLGVGWGGSLWKPHLDWGLNKQYG